MQQIVHERIVSNDEKGVRSGMCTRVTGFKRPRNHNGVRHSGEIEIEYFFLFEANRTGFSVARQY